MRRTAIVTATVFGFGIMVGWWSWSQAEAPEEDSLFKAIEEAHHLKSYNRAVQTAEQFVRQFPQSPRLPEVKVLVGKSQIGLGKWQEGIKTLREALAAHPDLARRPDLWEAIGKAEGEHRRWAPAAALEAYDKALALYQAAGNRQQQITVLLAVAFLIDHKEFPDLPWREAHLARAIEMLAVVDRLLALEPPPAIAIRAQNHRVQYLASHADHIQNADRSKLPAGMTSRYDLSKPLAVAIGFLRDVVARYPDHAGAAEAQADLAGLYADRLRDYLQALKEYAVVGQRWPASPAAERAAKAIQQIKAPQLSLRVAGVVLPGQTVELEWAVRNIAQVQFLAYKVDLFQVLRQVGQLSELQEYPVEAQARPVAQWTFATPDKGEHQFYSSDAGSRLPLPVKDSGAYLVVARGRNPEGQGAEARTLALVSRLGLVAKTGRSRGLFFAVDAVSGKPVPETDLLLQRVVESRYDEKKRRPIHTYEYTTGRVPDSGLYEYRYPAGERPTYDSWSRHLAAIARHGDDYALCENTYSWYWSGYRREYKVYGFTERPIYRPGQTVHFKQTVRRWKDGQYENCVGTRVRVVVKDPKNSSLYDRQMVTNAFGSVSGSLPIAEGAPLGLYRLEVWIDGQPEHYGWGQGNQFRVEEYKKPEFEITISPARDQYKIGDTVEVKINGRYYFGAPAAGAQVHYEIFRSEYHAFWRPWRPYEWFYAGEDREERWGRWHYSPRRELVGRGELVTDAQGNALVSFKSEPYVSPPWPDVQYTINVRMVDKSRREIRGSATIKVTQKAFNVYVEPERQLYQPGDKVRFKVTSRSPNEQPVPFQGTAAVWLVGQEERRDAEGRVTVEEKLLKRVHQQPIEVKADVPGLVTFEADEEGLFKCVVQTRDRFGETVEGAVTVWIAKAKGEFAHYAYRDIELVTDAQDYKLGQTARVLVNTRYAGSYVLLTVEADDLYDQQIVYVPQRSRTIELQIDRRYVPNVWLSACLFHENRLFSTQQELRVPPTDLFLDVKIDSPKPEFLPRERATFRVTARDAAGQPVRAELSLGFVDASIFYFQAPFRPDIRQFFHAARRDLRVATTSSYAYRHYGFGRELRRARGAGALDAMEVEAAAAPMAPARAEMLMEKKEARKATGADRDKEALAEPEVRTDFPDTFFWAAHLETDADGKAEVTVTFPDTLTTWRLTSTALTTDTRVGEVEHQVVTRKPVIVRLQSPRFYVETDRVALSAIVRNDTATARPVRVELKVSDHLVLERAKAPGAEVTGEPGTAKAIDITVKPAEDVRVDFWAKVLRPGRATVTALARTPVKEESDAMQMTFPVLEYGTEKFIASSGAIYATGEGTSPPCKLQLAIPAEIKPGSASLEVVISPSVAAVMLEALPYLFDYPYGCTEQTLSRFLPAVVSAHALQKVGLKLEDVAREQIAANNVERERIRQLQRQNPVYSSAEMRKIIDAGLKRLLEFQHADGGWGWWQHDASSPYMTAYVVYGLALARQADVAVPAEALQRGAAFLLNRVVSVQPAARWQWGDDDDNVRLFMLYSLGCVDAQRLAASAEAMKVLDRIHDNRDALNDYSRALLVLLLDQVGKRAQRDVVLDNLLDRAQVDPDGGSASWGKAHGWWYWYDSGVEATAFALRALLKTKPDSPRVRQAVTWLVRNRQGIRWHSTKDTALAVLALAEYLNASGELNPDLTVTVDVAGRFNKVMRVTRANLFTFDNRLRLAGGELPTGPLTVTLTRSGRGPCYYGVYLTYFTREEKLTGAGHELFVKRTYTRLTEKIVEKTRRVFDRQKSQYVEEKYRDVEYDRTPLREGDELRSGTLLEVGLEITARNNYEYLMFEDPKPAGAETVALRSGYTYGSFCSNMELRDTHVAFFATSLAQGTHTLTYQLRCETPGTFHALPCRASAMYAPHVRGTSDGHLLTVVTAD